ncbi:MAG: FGGY family carbohydrate kinase [Conexivisphaerales archaeon]
MYACIDVGTTNIKLSIYNDELDSIKHESVKVPVSSEGLQDPLLVLQAVKHFFKIAKESGARSAGIACYRSSMVAWDREGNPLSSIVTWLSSSSENTYTSLSRIVRAIGKIPPLDLVISPVSPALRFLAVQRELESRFGRNQKNMIWTLDSFLMYNLTKTFVSDATNSALTGLIDPARFTPLSPVLALLRINPDFPEIVDNARYYGEYEGLEIRALIADQQAACVAEGALEEGLGKVTNGTGTFVDIPLSKYRRIDGLIPIVILRHNGKAIYGAEGYLPTSGSAVDFMIRSGLLKSYDELDKFLMPNVLFIPALAGLQIPSLPKARGIITNIGLTTSREEILSSLLLSISFHVRYVIEKYAGRLSKLRADGKLSISNSLLKLISSSTGLPVERFRDVEATQRGLAILQKISLGKMGLNDIDNNRPELINGERIEGLEDAYKRWKGMLNSLRNYQSS